jgi:iron complex transport system ATP-binding protein
LTDTSPALEVQALDFAYDGPPVLEGLDLRIDTGELVGIIGPNGSGKTTLLRLIAGTLEPASGGVRLFGRDLESVPRRLRAQTVSVVPQEARVVFDFTVHEIVLMGRAPHLGLLGIEGERDRQVAEDALRATDTLDMADARLAELSGGEKQRVLMARALAQEAPLMLLDEPTAYLDLRHRLELYRLVERLRGERGLTVVAVSHDIHLAARFCPRLVMLHRGRVAADGPPVEVITRQNLRRVYEADVHIVEDPVSGAPLVVPASDPPGPVLD